MESEFLNLMVESGNSYKRRSRAVSQQKRASSAGFFRAGDVFKINSKNSEFLPLFRSTNLNRCNFQKSVILNTNYFSSLSNTVSTKIILPFGNNISDPTNYLFMYVGEENFLEKLERAFNFSMPQSDKESDLNILRLMDRMPTFDPFLLRDMFETEGIEADSLYSEVNDNDFNFVKSGILEDFNLIVSKTLGLIEESSEKAALWDPTVSAAAERLFKAMWYLDDLEALEPLARAMGVKNDDSKEYFYSWKGLLFYVHGHSSSFSLLEEDLVNVAKFAQSDGRGDKDAINYHINNILKEKRKLAQFFEEYNAAFKGGFIEQKDTSRFVKILTNARSLFWMAGTTIGRLDIYTSYFSQLRESSRNGITAEDMRVFLRNMEVPSP